MYPYYCCHASLFLTFWFALAGLQARRGLPDSAVTAFEVHVFAGRFRLFNLFLPFSRVIYDVKFVKAHPCEDIHRYYDVFREHNPGLCLAMYCSITMAT